MRELCTPPYGKGLFSSILARLADRAEICVVRAGNKPVAAALLLHGWGGSEVPTASCVRSDPVLSAAFLKSLLGRIGQRHRASKSTWINIHVSQKTPQCAAILVAPWRACGAGAQRAFRPRLSSKAHCRPAPSAGGVGPG